MASTMYMYSCNTEIRMLVNMRQLTSLAEEPDTSIQVLEKNAQDPSIKMMYMTACIGSSIM